MVSSSGARAVSRGDRLIGSLLGLAVGDAVGTTVEFKPRGTFPPMTDMVGGGPFDLLPGQWTDDTSMALCLAESLQVHPKLDERDLMERFARWRSHGYNSATGECFDIGITTAAAISRYLRTGNPVAGENGARSAGNGSIMRLAPVAIRWWRNPCVAEEVARRQSCVTHAATEAVEGCVLLLRAILAAISSQSGCEIRVSQERDWPCSLQRIATREWSSKAVSEIASTGYVIDTLEAALWSVYRTSSFRDAILTAVNLGHDADTVGAVTGQIAGALYGASGIPGEWLDRLHERQRIEGLAQSLFQAASN